MIPEKDYERVILELERDRLAIVQILERVKGNIKRLRDDFYENK